MRTLFIATAALLAVPANAAFIVTYENPGVENSSAVFSSSGVETFDGLPTGPGQNVTTDFGTGGVITGVYSDLGVLPADQYGGAGGAGNYAVTFSSSGYSLDLTTTDPAGINYFGFYLSALDTANTLTFFKGGVAVYSFTPAAVIAAIGSNPGYFGNPDAPFQGANNSQIYTFVNVFDNGDTFDRIVFAENPQQGGYESDNHTVGFFTDRGGNGVPEAATWVMMIVGFGLIGVGARRRTVAVAA